MRGWIGWIVGLLVSAMLSAGLFQQDKGSVTVKAPVGQGKQAFATRRALVIGIEKYPYLSPPGRMLHLAVDDAEAFARLLETDYGFRKEDIRLLRDHEATKAAIMDALNELADSSKVSPDDQVIVFFSGHGVTAKQQTGSEMGFLVPTDARVNLLDSQNAGPIVSACLSMRDVREKISFSPARHVLLLADACFSGDFGTSRGAFTKEAIAKLLAQPARQFISAGKKGQSAWELSELGHGVFTAKLLDVMKDFAAKKQAFTAMELYAEVHKRVTAIKGVPQEPQIGDFETTGHVLLFPAGAAVEEEPPKPPESGAGVGAPTPGALGVGSKMKTKVGGIDMVYVPAGEFLMGNDNPYSRGNPNESFQDEKPARKVYLDAYWIAETEVTVRQFRAFCEETGYRFSWEYFAKKVSGWDDERPMSCVTWSEARMFCEWVGGDLPTEAQWEKAARGPANLPFPWGRFFDQNWLYVTNNDVDGPPARVGSYSRDKSGYGCLDMAGNVTEWCRDWYGPYDPMDLRNPKGPVTGTHRVLRPRSMALPTEQAHNSYVRDHKDPINVSPIEGFRVVVEVPNSLDKNTGARLVSPNRLPSPTSQQHHSTPKTS